MVQFSRVVEGAPGLMSVRQVQPLVYRPALAATLPLSPTNAFHESIIGSDDRIIESDTFRLPQRLVVSLTIFANSGARFFGSGWLASHRVVMTCGHCVFDRQLGGFAARIEVVPGRSGPGQSTKDRPFGTFESTVLHAHPAWKSNADPAHDIGCIVLTEALGDTVGHFGIGQVAPAKSIEGRKLRCAGYPIFDGSHSRQLSGEGTAKSVVGTRLYHDIDTENGTSGGPIWLTGSDKSPPTVVAIHSYEKQALPGHPGELANSATLISEGIFETIQTWTHSTA